MQDEIVLAVAGNLATLAAVALGAAVYYLFGDYLPTLASRAAWQSTGIASARVEERFCSTRVEERARRWAQLTAFSLRGLRDRVGKRGVRGRAGNLGARRGMV